MSLRNAEWIDLIDKFESAIFDAQLRTDVLAKASKNIPAMLNHAEAESIDFFASYRLVYAVWIEPEGVVQFRKIKGPDRLDHDLVFNALPVLTEMEAMRWSALLAESEADEAAAGIRLASKDGMRVSDSA
jgi:hypothetical protein